MEHEHDKKGEVLFDYAAIEDDELTIRQGDQFKLLELYDDGWWLIDVHGNVGVVPSNYVKILSKIDSPLPKKKKDKLSPTKKGSFDFELSPHKDNGNKSELVRLKNLREEASVKIDALRNAVNNHESHNGSLKGLTTNRSLQSLSDNDETPFKRNPSKSNLSRNNSNELITKSVPQVTLDPSSIDYISKIINDKITKELASRENKIFEHVQDIINRSLYLNSIQSNKSPERRKSQDMALESKINLSPEPKITRSAQSSRYKSKIPRIKLPKVNHSISADSYSGRSANGQGKGVISAMNSNPSTPSIAQPKTKGKESKLSNNNISVSEGCQYPQCRSVVYPSLEDSVWMQSRNLQPVKELSLHKVIGYDGDPSKRGGAFKSKNVLYLPVRRIAFPAAALVVILDIETGVQSFFSGHTDDVTTIVLHPDKDIIASGQINNGSDCKINLWSHSLLKEGFSLNRANKGELNLPAGCKGVNSLDFSRDGRFLLSCGVEEAKMVYIFDWKLGQIITCAKINQIDFTQMFFNPFSFTPFEETSQITNKNTPIDIQPGCYTLISYSAKHIKFWTLKSQIDYQKQKMNRNNSNIKIMYSLEGSQTSIPTKKSGPTQSIDYTACEFVVADPYNPTLSTRILLGTSNGSIHIWEQLIDEESDEILGNTWLPKGKLLMVIAEAHESYPIVEIGFYWNPMNELENKIVTSDSNGTLNIWKINSAQPNLVKKGNSGGLPLVHVAAVQLEESYARSVSWDSTGEEFVIGTAVNSLFILKTFLDEETNGSLNIEMKRLLTSHNGKVKKINVNPIDQNIFATISSDRSVRIWDSNQTNQISCIDLEYPATAVSFSSDGKSIALGNEQGELLILKSPEFSRWVNSDKNNRNTDSDNFLWQLELSKIVAASTSSVPQKGYSTARLSITELKYSPHGDLLAVGCKDSFIHILSVQGGYRHVSLCKGHTSQIRNLDFSSDGKYIKSNDTSKELLFWEVESGQRVTNANLIKEIVWASFSCIYGWPLQGVFNRYEEDRLVSPDSEINCVARSFDGQCIAAAGTHTVAASIKLFAYPCLNDSIPFFFGGHTSPVTDLAFVRSGSRVLVASAGGNDSCIFLWEVVSC